MKKSLPCKHLLSAVVLVGVQALTMSSAHANWYGEVSVFNNDLDSTDLNSTGRAVNSQFDEDLATGLAIGYQYDSGLRVEAEYLDTENDAEQIIFNGNTFNDIGTNVVGGIETTSLFFNSIHNFNTDTSVSPYIGAGLGYTKVESDLAYNPTFGASIRDDDTTFSYQLLLGLDVAFTDNLKSFIEYRYVDAGNVDLSRTGGGPGGIQTTTQNGDITFDGFGAGLRYHF